MCRLLEIVSSKNSITRYGGSTSSPCPVQGRGGKSSGPVWLAFYAVRLLLLVLFLFSRVFANLSIQQGLWREDIETKRHIGKSACRTRLGEASCCRGFIQLFLRSAVWRQLTAGVAGAISLFHTKRRRRVPDRSIACTQCRRGGKTVRSQRVAPPRPRRYVGLLSASSPAHC